MRTSVLLKLSVEELASQVQADLRRESRKWLQTHKIVNLKAIGKAEVHIPAMYLHKHKELFVRENTQATKDMHQHWMQLMQAWVREELYG